MVLHRQPESYCKCQGTCRHNMIIGYTVYIVGNGKVVIWYTAYTVGNVVDMKHYHKFHISCSNLYF
jgi:hypothetical protein